MVLGVRGVYHLVDSDTYVRHPALGVAAGVETLAGCWWLLSVVVSVAVFVVVVVV